VREYIPCSKNNNIILTPNVTAHKNEMTYRITDAAALSVFNINNKLGACPSRKKDQRHIGLCAQRKLSLSDEFQLKFKCPQ
jgi:hypothetical protein